MKKFWTVFKSEYTQVVKKKSFIVGILLTPLFMIAISILPAYFASRDVAKTSTYSIVDLDGRDLGQRLANSLDRYRLEPDTSIHSYILKNLYAVDPNNADSVKELRSYLDSLVQNKGLSRYVVIFPNAEQTDSVLLVSKSMSFKTTGRYDRRMSDILTEKRLENSNISTNIDTVLNITRRIDMIEESPGGKSKDFMATYFGALIFVFIIFGSVMGFGQILMRSVIEEKNSRVMEVLMSSVTPFQLMMGKVLGLGAANLTQIGVWALLGAGLFVARGSVAISSQVSNIIFNPVIIVFFVLFMVVAYIMYSTFFALVGSICSTDKEAQNFIFPITMSLMAPVFLMMYIVQQPDSLITTILSFIPFLTPTMMMARINIAAPETFAFSDPIILEAFLGLLVAIVFCIGMIWLTSKIFRMGILMYGKRATLPEIMKWVRYK